MAGEEAGKTGQRVREVSTSLISSSPLPCNNCRRKGPTRAERKVRGEPEGSRLRTERAADDEKDVAEEEGRKYVGVVGTKGGCGGREEHPRSWRRE